MPLGYDPSFWLGVGPNLGAANAHSTYTAPVRNLEEFENVPIGAGVRARLKYSPSSWVALPGVAGLVAFEPTGKDLEEFVKLGGRAELV